VELVEEGRKMKRHSRASRRKKKNGDILEPVEEGRKCRRHSGASRRKKKNEEKKKEKKKTAMKE
jgi:hypothetical protein